ncbi:MAG: septal ring lytic transglycosylase RlpA family protein [Gemmatimonadota bacterium]
MIIPAPLRPSSRLRPAAWLPVVLLLHGCALAGGPAAPPPSPGGLPAGWSEVGMASWYGHPYHGRATASGESYDMEAPTGAHRTLPFGTRLRVENLDNGRSATLTINDRGPFAKERILDVSRRVAEELGMLGPGTARVRITILEVHQPHIQIEDGSAYLGSRTRAETFGEEVP